MKFKRTIFLLTVAVTMGLLLGTSTAQEVEKRWNVATAIRNLPIGSNTYDVEFQFVIPYFFYGDPPVFDTNNSTEAKRAAETVVAVLTAEGDIFGVGESPWKSSPIFRVPWQIDTIDVDGVPVRYLNVWEGVTGDGFNQGSWGVPSEDDLWPFIDEGVVATFTLVSTGGPGNAPPVADAGGPYDGAVGVAVQFDGSGSSDPDGSIQEYEWNFGDGNTATEEKPEHVYEEANNYNVTLTVRDNLGLPNSESTTARIGAVGIPPVADAGGPYSGSVDATVQFDGSGSSDPDDNIVWYRWDFGDGSTGIGGPNEVAPTHTYTASGNYTVTLEVWNDALETDTDTATAEIGEGNMPPVADAGGGYLGFTGNAVEFDGTRSSDPDGSIQQYEWDFGDGGSGTGPTPSHVYETIGMKTVTLTVTDNDGFTNTDDTVANITFTFIPGGN